jgi:hypothetical protein
MGDFLDFQRGHIIGAHLAGASNQNGHFIMYMQSSSLQGYDNIHKSWEDIIS